MPMSLTRKELEMALMPAVTVVPAFQLLIIMLTAFLTVVDLFATQALLPTLAAHYNVSPAAMGLAVNASTLGMAIGGLSIALLSQRIDRRTGILASLLVLSIPTLLLAYAPNLAIFASLRVAQGLCMASAFGLTLAHLGESFTAEQSAGAFAAYITGNVASNLVGRFIAAAVVDHAGLAANFVVFAGLNIAGAALVYTTIKQVPMPKKSAIAAEVHPDPWWIHIKETEMRAAFGIGFCILFAFIGTFTYVNFILVAPPLAVGMMTLGFIYFVFLPSIVTTPLAGSVARKIGHKRALCGGLAVAAAGLPLLVVPSLPAVLARHDPRRRGDVLRAGACDGVCQPGGEVQPCVGEWHLFGKLFRRGPCRQCRAWSDFRSLRMDGVRRRNWSIARCRCVARTRYLNVSAAWKRT